MKIVFSMADECPLSDTTVPDPTTVFDFAFRMWNELGRPQMWVFDKVGEAPWYCPGEPPIKSKKK